MTFKFKKIFYISLSSMLGLLFGLILYGISEKALLHDFFLRGETPVTYIILGYITYLPPPFGIGFPVGGVVLGIIVGFRWWDIVYVKKKRHFKLRREN